MKALFVCDDKEQWNELYNLFRTHLPKIELICAIKGSDAIEYISFEGPFAVVMIECSIQSDEPTELANQILDVAGERPIIFMGTKSFVDSRIAEDLITDHELNNIIYRPFDPDQFNEILKKALNWAEDEEFEESIEELDREELLPMKIRNFYLFNKIPYEVFLELTQVKFIKIIAPNQKYTHSTIQKYSRRNIKCLYLKKNDYLKFLEDGIEKVNAALEKKPLKAKHALPNQIKGILIIHQYIRTVGISADIINLATKIIKVTSQIYDDNQKNWPALFRSIPFEQGDFAEQSLMTAYLNEAILDGLGWKSDISRSKLGLASILQDCMITNEDLSKIRSLEDPNLQMFTEEEQEEYRSHSTKAAELSQHFQGYPDVDFIIAQHHERPDATGFPMGLTSNKFSAHSALFILSSNFVMKYGLGKRTPRDIALILEDLNRDFSIANFKEPLLHLIKSFRKSER